MNSQESFFPSSISTGQHPNYTKDTDNSQTNNLNLSSTNSWEQQRPSDLAISEYAQTILKEQEQFPLVGKNNLNQYDESTTHS